MTPWRGKAAHGVLLNGLKSNQINPSALCSTADCRVSQSESAQTPTGQVLYQKIPETRLDGCLRFYFILHATPELHITRQRLDCTI